MADVENANTFRQPAARVCTGTRSIFVHQWVFQQDAGPWPLSSTQQTSCRRADIAVDHRDFRPGWVHRDRPRRWQTTRLQAQPAAFSRALARYGSPGQGYSGRHGGRHAADHPHRPHCRRHRRGFRDHSRLLRRVLRRSFSTPSPARPSTFCAPFRRCLCW